MRVTVVGSGFVGQTTAMRIVQRHLAEVVLIDITGVSIVDTSVAGYIIQAAQAARLLGAETVLGMEMGDGQQHLPPGSLPGGTQNGQVFRLKGQGMPAVSKPDERGDLFATVDIQLPRELSPEQRKHYEALAKLDEREKTTTAV